MKRVFSLVLLITVEFAVSVNSDPQKSGSGHEAERIIRRDEWETYSTGIYGPYGWNKNSLLVKVGLWLDERMLKNAKDPKTVIQECRDVVYKLNLFSQKFNIYIALVSLDTWTSPNKTDWSSYEDYEKFLEPPPKKLMEKGNVIDLAHFISSYTCTTEGWATYDFSCDKKSLITGIFCGDINIYSFSHDLLCGIFGVSETNCTVFGCEKDGRFEWCPCVVEQVEENLAQWGNKYHCLKNKPTRLFGEPMCGNGYLERGEECDCGSTESCGNTMCCNAKTCRRFPDVPCLMGRL